MAVMADFARLPTQRKVLVFVVGAAMLAGLYFQFVFKSLKADIEDAEADHDNKEATNKRLEADIPKFEALKTRMQDLTRVIAENQKALPTESELPAFFETLNRKVNEAGVEVNNWRQVKEEPVETFMKVPVEIEMTGTFMQIKRFFASLVPKKKKPGQTLEPGQVEERERVVSIENLSLTNPVVKNREIILTARFTATTYREGDKPVPPAGSAPPPPPKKSTAPSSSPASPRGAKQRTEDALDKADQRNRNATGVDEAKTPGGSGSARLKGGM
jgi:type IV pilus assembly protein PilO